MGRNSTRAESPSGFGTIFAVSAPEKPITELLNEWAAGDPKAKDKAFALVYDQLHQIAAAHLRRERRDPVFQTTGIVHEAFLRLSGQPDLSWKSREHFFAFASRVMRRVLVDHARHRGRAKRGGQSIHVSLAEVPEEPHEVHAEIVAIHEALESLEAVDPAKARIIELRFFGGLSAQETATVLEVSESTVHRQWRLARAWLFDALQGKLHQPPLSGLGAGAGDD